MKFLFLITFALLMSSTSHGAIPTMEGLFRNGINKDISGKLVVVKLKISKDFLEKKAEVINKSLNPVQENEVVTSVENSEAARLSSPIDSHEDQAIIEQKKLINDNFVKIIFALNSKNSDNYKIIE